MAIEHLAWGLRLPDLSPSARMVLLVLCDAANASGYAEVPSDYVQRRSCQSAGVVAGRLRELEEAGLIAPVASGWQIRHSAAGGPLPQGSDLSEQRRERDRRIFAEMEERRPKREPPSEEECRRVAQLAEETKRALSGPRLPYRDD